MFEATHQNIGARCFVFASFLHNIKSYITLKLIQL